MEQSLDTYYWDSLSEKIISHHLEKNIAIYKKSEHIKLIKKWALTLKGKKILKTDLYEEAFGEDHFLFWLLKQNENTFGMDISYNIAKKAKLRSGEFNTTFKNCIVSDIRNCAFKDDSFDLIISNSTIDNLQSKDVPSAFRELRRILKPSGILILTLDNIHNPLYRLGYTIEKILRTNRHYQGSCYSLKTIKRLAQENKLKILDSTAIVHIPTPFNKLALFLSKFKTRETEKIIRLSVSLFSKLGNKRINLLTGWFIAAKLTKNDN